MIRKFLFLTLINCLALSANDNPLSGKVLDAETKEPLPFTNIAVIGKQLGTVSNLEGYFMLEAQPEDSIVFSYVGYRSAKFLAADLFNQSQVRLNPASVNLKEVHVSSKALTTKEILKKVEERFESNHNMNLSRQEVFFHKYERSPFSKDNKIRVKKSNFVGLDGQTVDELMAMMPEEMVEYQDAQVELYQGEGGSKLVPIQAVSLEEGSQKELAKELEDKLQAFMDDLEQTVENPDTYFKIRTGVFAFKMDPEEEGDTLWKENERDSLNYSLSTNAVKTNINHLYKDYAHIDSKYWEFVNKPGKYHYNKKDITVIGDELVYEIHFSPKKGGLYQGRIFVSTSSFAVLQLDFAFAGEKVDEKFQVLGIGHALKYRSGRVIFEKDGDNYPVKYINAQQHEWVSIDRDFSFKKKEKRALTDKELNEIKFEVELEFDMNSSWELLVLNRDKIITSQYEAVEEPDVIKYKKEYAHTPEMWSNGTVIVPTSELKKYTRKN